MQLYDEVLERIESNYVDSVPIEPLVRQASTTSRSRSATGTSSGRSRPRPGRSGRLAPRLLRQTARPAQRPEPHRRDPQVLDL